MKSNNVRRLLRDDDSQSWSPQPPSNHTPAATDRAEGLTRFDSSSITVTALVLLSALFFLGFFSLLGRRFFAADHDADQSRHHRMLLPPYSGRYGVPSSSSAPGLDPTTIRDLPLLLYSGGKERVGCVVCLSEFDDKETVKAIPSCGHVFHPDCIDAWLLRHGSCPLCRSTRLCGLMGSTGEVCVDVLAGERSDGEQMVGTEEDTNSRVELVRGREVEVGRDGLEERGREVGKPVGLGRSSSWCCRTGEKAFFLRRSCSL